jgi:hypothetical protein
MSAVREPVKPTSELTLTDAVQELTGFEALLVERRFNKKLEELGGTSLTIGVVWAYENRDGNKRAWSSVENMSFRELTGYFTPEPEDPNETEPDSDAGKDDWSDAGPIPN